MVKRMDLSDFNKDGERTGPIHGDPTWQLTEFAASVSVPDTTEHLQRSFRAVHASRT